MKTLISSLLILLGFSVSSISIIAQLPTPVDIYGRAVISPGGEKINYFKPAKSLEILDLKFAQINKHNKSDFGIPKDTTQFAYCNLFTIMGTSIGRNSMHSIDIDNDGILELICTASSSSYGSADYWYILRYNSSDSLCTPIWTSKHYETRITSLEIVDLNNSGNYTIITSFENGSLHLYDGASRKLISNIKPINERINSIIYADANNDSYKNLVITSDYNTYILDARSFEILNTIEDGSDYVRVGNINADGLLEIVLSSGATYQVHGSTITPLWEFSTSNDGYIELSDLDNDGKQEIVFAESWYYIYVFDADTETRKFSIEADLDIQALLLHDVNNDGVDDIIYGDGQWGNVYCINSVTREEIWSVRNPEHGVAAINYVDLDSDGTKELIWSAGWTSTGSDYLYIYDVNTDRLEWRSADIVGPFYAIATGDVDGDEIPEIVAISYESESGYDGGVIHIFDAQTKMLKWQSSSTFLYLVWTGVYDLAIEDIDADGNNEIIVAAGRTYDGKIWIIDGNTKSIESVYEFRTEDIDEFYALTIVDFDNDGSLDIIAASDSRIYQIDPSDWSVDWNEAITSNYTKPTIQYADINGDLLNEIVVCKGTIQIIYNDYSIWTSTENNYKNIDLFDVNSDGDAEIVASTVNGFIVILDGETREVLQEMQPEDNEIGAIKVFERDHIINYVYSCNGRINIYQDDNDCTTSQYFSSSIGEYNGLQIFEFSDTNSILVGTKIGLLQLIESAKYQSPQPHHVAGIWDHIESNLSFYPNPTNGEFFIKSNYNDAELTYILYEVNGDVIKTNTLSYGINNLDLSDLSSGFYFIKVYSANKSYTEKITIQ